MATGAVSVGALNGVMVGGRPDPWSPLKISNCVLWLDASQISGLSDGDDIATWSDLSGNSRDFTQGTASSCPHYTVNIQNGLAVARFTNNAHRMIGADWEMHSNTTGLTITAVFSASGDNSEIIIAKYSGDRQWWMETNQFQLQESLAAYNAATIAPMTEQNGQGWVCCMHIWIPGGKGKTYIAGVLDGTADTAVTDIGDGTALVYLGNYVNAGEFGGDMGEIIVYSKALSGTEITALTNHLEAKWGI